MRSLIALILLCGCTTTLSDEQRKKIKEEMADREIRRIPEAELLQGAQELGRELSAQLSATDTNLSVQMPALEQWNVRLHWVSPGSTNLAEIEHQLIEAYIAGGALSQEMDNIQSVADTILYSRPLMIGQPDGSARFAGVWNLYIPVRSVIRKLDAARDLQ
jgi:hypothetical protein